MIFYTVFVTILFRNILLKHIPKKSFQRKKKTAQRLPHHLNTIYKITLYQNGPGSLLLPRQPQNH